MHIWIFDHMDWNRKIKFCVKKCTAFQCGWTWRRCQSPERVGMSGHSLVKGNYDRDVSPLQFSHLA